MVNDLKAGQERHYRVFALVGTAVAESAEMSWPSDQKSGNTAPPLVPKKPTSLTARAVDTRALMWPGLPLICPVATNDDLDGSEEGTTVIKGYYIEYSDDEGKTWNALVTDDNGRAKIVEGIQVHRHWPDARADARLPGRRGEHGRQQVPAEHLVQFGCCHDRAGAVAQRARRPGCRGRWAERHQAVLERPGRRGRRRSGNVVPDRVQP